MPRMPKNKNEPKILNFVWVNNKVELTIYQCIRIIVLYGLGFSMCAIARDMEIAHLTVIRLIKKANETGKIEDLKRSGRPKALTQEEEERIVELINSGECEIATEVHSKFSYETNYEISVETRKHPVINETAKKVRYEFAKKYESWTVDDWKKVIFSDKSRF
ncbi:5290_t:CDS:2, partial [Cetraspora pellucida]